MTRTDVRVAAYGVIVREGAMLLAHWQSDVGSGWTLPGGGLDPFEDPADAAIREIREETGYEARLGELLAVDSIVIPAERRPSPDRGDLHGIRVLYRAEITGGELRDEVDGSTDTAAWIPLSDIPALDTVSLVDVALTHVR